MAASETTRRALARLKTIPGDVRERTTDLADDVRETTRQIARQVVPTQGTSGAPSTQGPATFHVRRHGAGWAVEREDTGEIERIFSSRSAAVQVGLSEARIHQGHLLVHDDDGTIVHVQSFTHGQA